MKLQDHLPVDHRLGQVYRYSAGAIGLFLIVFGILGFTNNVGFFSTTGDHVAGMTSNGALSLLSVLFGALLVGGAAVGGNFASTLNIAVGILFIISGWVNLGLIDGPNNILNFRMRNIIFSFAVGLALLLFGMYGRVTLHLPSDNPYWRNRHPEAAKANPLPPRALPHG
ncbi:DUF4383 domain-containing protein [Streptacidiphilus anmyonensis]|uniref:DUF4383 domain-containing protein n=1 Tax=Streptacidiphilus anmyonensis TaxID=405782 RepID=UPI0005A6F531|nr:DUF4383 domain-containing protein [Streptacidiphilus anmyonensis]